MFKYLKPFPNRKFIWWVVCCCVVVHHFISKQRIERVKLSTKSGILFALEIEHIFKFFHHLWVQRFENRTHLANVFSFRASTHFETWNNNMKYEYVCAVRFQFKFSCFLCAVHIEMKMSFNIQNIAIQVSGHIFDFHLVCFSF